MIAMTVAGAAAETSRRIQEIEAKRVLKNRSDRSRLAPESQPIQDAIDAYIEAKKRYKPGTFLIQHCLPGESAYTQTFYSRVIFG